MPLNSNSREITVRNLPGNLKGRFKAYCSTRGVTMRDQIIKMMKDVMDKAERLKNK